MKLLYLSEDYAASKVHHELVTRLVTRDFNVEVFTVTRLSDSESDIRSIYTPKNYKVNEFGISKFIEVPYKFLFGFKRRLKLRKLLSQINISDIDIVHAATLFSEGVVAYDLYKKYGIPYTVAVRGTDIDLYLAKMPHLWHLGKRILENSSKIIFISPIIQKNFSQRIPIRGIFNRIKSKCIIIPNGIEDYWIENLCNKRIVSNPNQILYIGRFDENKNVESLVHTVLNLIPKIPNIKLNLVGGGDVCHDTIMGYCTMYPQHIQYYGKVYDKGKLKEILRQSHIFAMLSHCETFGLVYLEALSQGLPILYTSGQGIDGSVKENVGEKANSHDIEDIKKQLLKIISNYNSYQSIGDSIYKFSWDKIADKYSEQFNKIIIG